MQKVDERPNAKRALLVTSVVLAVAGGVALAERKRRKNLVAKQRNELIPWGVVGCGEL